MNGLGIIFSTVALGSFVVAAISAVSRLFPSVRVSYQDGQYLVSVRHGLWHDIRDFVQPSNPDALAVYSQLGPNTSACLDFICRNISYRPDIGEFWRIPSETLASGEGDCEDSAILLTSLLRNFTNAYVVLGDYQGWGHAWVASEDGEVLETTYTEARAVPDPEDYCPYFMFNDAEALELWPGALADVFQLGRNEAKKFNLMAVVLA